MKSINRVEVMAFLFGLIAIIVIWISIHGFGLRDARRMSSMSGPNPLTFNNAACLPNSDNCGVNEHSNTIQNVMTSNKSDTSVQTVTGQASRDWTAPILANPRQLRPLTKLGSARKDTASSSNISQAAASASVADEAANQLQVRVYLSDTGDIERVPLEQYVRGVIAAEIPPGFEPAALEAQALAARTYIVRRLLKHDNSGVPSPDADITDTQMHQVYLSKAGMDKLRKRDKQTWQAIENATARTQGLIIAYEGEPIEALYFSSSNGYTENAEDVFGHALPYLRSVDSPWDRQNAPRSQDDVTMEVGSFYKKLGIDSVPAAANAKPAISVQELTAGQRVRTLKVGDRTFSGKQVREMLGLRSADFSWRITDDKITITTRGSGHGVGMSQWGAQGMALAGYQSEEIVRHYYTGIELMEVSKLAGEDS